MTTAATTRALLLAALLVLVPAAGGIGSEPAGTRVNRFFHGGDGRIRLDSEKNNNTFWGVYRIAPGQYDAGALAAICAVFDAPYTPGRPAVSLRLIEYLDHLEDRLRPGARITITSGYRSPEYNTKVRNRGSLAAKASLHQYGMAADFKMAGVPAEHVWQTVKALRFGGAGYYHGETVHVDVGPARSWDEKTSGVGTGISDDNKLVGIVTDYDVYRPGERALLRFIRMTAFPIGVTRKFALERETDAGTPETAAVFEPAFAVAADGVCPQFGDIDQMGNIRWRLPPDLPPGRYRVRAPFCGNPWTNMPDQVTTPVFEVVP